MRFVIDLDSLELIAAANDRNAVVQVQGKRGDNSPFEVTFVRSGVAEELAASSVLTFGAKEAGKYDGAAVILDASFAKSGSGTAAKYLATPSFNTTALNALFLIDANTSNDPAYVDLMAEFTWQVGSGAPTSTKTFSLRVHNDVLRDGEASPTPATAAVTAPVNAVAANTRLTPPVPGLGAGDTVIIDGITYTGAVTLTANYQFKELATPELTMQALVDCINKNGATSGTAYYASTPIHPSVSATRDGVLLKVTAKTPGSAGNSIAVSNGGTWSDDTLIDGVDATAGSVGKMMVDANFLYVVTAVTSGQANWRSITLGDLA